MKHLVFEELNATILQEAFALDENLCGTIYVIKDDYATGPLAVENTDATHQQRKDWWQEVLKGSPYENQIGLVNDQETIQAITHALEVEPEEELWIWMGQNSHDVSGYYWILPFLKLFAGRVMVLFMNNLPFMNEKGGIFYPTHLHEIQPKEFLKAKKLARPITGSEWEVDPEEWNRLLSQESMVRFLEGGKKLVAKSIDMYDAEIKKSVTAEWQKLAKITAGLLSKNKSGLTDTVIAWRLRLMAEHNEVEWQDEKNKGWKETQIRLAGVNSAENPA
jgi:hypothetical protein